MWNNFPRCEEDELLQRFFFNFYLKNIVHVYKLITVVFLIFELK